MRNISTYLILLSVVGFMFMIICARVGYLKDYPDVLNAKLSGISLKDMPKPIYVSDVKPPDVIASPMFSVKVTNDDLDNMSVVSHFIA